MGDQRYNCWDYQGCGRGPGFGGDCPACSADSLDGVHNGSAGGRACWVVTDTLCEGTASGPFVRKISMCRKCAFYYRVAVEEGLDHLDNEELLELYRDPDAE